MFWILFYHPSIELLQIRQHTKACYYRKRSMALLTPLEGFEQWGNYLLPPRFTDAEIAGHMRTIRDKGGVASFDVGVETSGNLVEDYKTQLRSIAAALDGFPKNPPIYVEENGDGITFVGDWSMINNADDHGGAYAETSDDGDYVEYTFLGTGIDVLMRREALESGDTPNTFQVFLDGSVSPHTRTDINGNSILSYTADNGVLMNQVPVVRIRGLVNESHTIRLVKTAGNKLQLDAFRVIGELEIPEEVVTNEEVVNNDDTRITYSSNDNWRRFSGRPGNIDGDVHATRTLNAYAEFSFTGTGIKFITEVRPAVDGVPGFADIEVTLDGNVIGTFPTEQSPIEKRYELYSNNELTYGEHTIRVTNKTDGAWIHVDAFIFSDTTPQSVVITPTGITQTAGNTLSNFDASHMIDNSGLSGTPTVSNLSTITHTGGVPNVWATRTFSYPNYFNGSNPNPQFTLDLGEVRSNVYGRLGILWKHQ